MDNLRCPQCGTLKFKIETPALGGLSWAAGIETHICENDHAVQIKRYKPEFKTVQIGQRDEVIE